MVSRKLLTFFFDFLFAIKRMLILNDKLNYSLIYQLIYRSKNLQLYQLQQKQMSLKSKEKLSKNQPALHNTNELVQSKILTQNPYNQLIQQIKQYLVELQKLKVSQQEALKQQQKKVQLETQQKKSSQEVEQNKSKQLQRKVILSPQQKIDILKKRLELLGGNLGYSPARLDNLQKIFSHYCSYIFKAGRHVTFDRIQYEKSHLIMERYFAFIYDFHLNRIMVGSQQKELIDKQELILIFKRASSSTRNLQFSQFLSAIQRLAVSHYDCQVNYQARMNKIKADRRKFKDTNQKRKKQKQRRQKQREEALRMQFQKSQQQSIETTIQEQKSNQQQKQKQKVDLDKLKLELFKKKSKQKKKKGSDKPESPEKQKNENNQNNQNNQNLGESNNNNNNDDLINKMMEDQKLENPNQEFQKLNKNFNNKTQDKTKEKPKQKNLDQLLQLSKEEKIELFLRLIEVDNIRAIQTKLRRFQDPLYKQLSQNEKANNLLSSSKLRQNQLKNQLRLGQLKQKIKERQKEKLKSSLVKSISVQKYQMKKKSFHQRYMKKALQDWDAQHQKERATYRRKDQGIQLSLEILNNSNADKIDMKNSPFRFLVPQEEDNVFLDEYGGYDKKLRRSISSFSKQHNVSKSPKNNQQMVDNLKRRAQQLQEVQKKYEENKLSRFALQMYKNQHYMKKFLQKKW